MVQVFNKNGLWEEPYAPGFQVQISKAFIKRHGKGKTEEILRHVMLRFREVDEAVPSFTSEKQHTVTVDASVRDRLKFLAQQRGLCVNALIRESLHCHLLKKAEPVGRMNTKPVAVQLCLSPFEEKLLNQWREINCSGCAGYLSTLASVTRPLPHADLSALSPVQPLTLYPAPEFLDQFLHSARVYGYLGAPVFRSILAFLDRPFDKGRTQDRYLDWLTDGYASTLRL